MTSLTSRLRTLKVSESRSTKQTGVALIVVLIFIVALTSLAIYSAQDVSLGERLARNQLDAQVAREAAEAALRDAEFDLLLASGVQRTGANCARGLSRPVVEASFRFNSNCDQGQCNFPAAQYIASNYLLATSTLANFEPWWPPSKGGRWNDNLSTKPTGLNVNCGFVGAVPYGTFSGRVAIVGVSRQPEYLIESFTPQKYYRITARGFGRNPNTEVVLQSYFLPFQ